jgi:rRNA maturation endonuclease Nob1
MNDSFLKELDKLFDLVESGVLPESAIPRMFYFGHTALHSTYKKVRSYKCISCMNVWESETSDVCPTCLTHENVYDITGDSQMSFWECKACKHQFEAKDGTVCPKCGDVRK